MWHVDTSLVSGSKVGLWLFNIACWHRHWHCGTGGFSPEALDYTREPAQDPGARSCVIHTERCLFHHPPHLEALLSWKMLENPSIFSIIRDGNKTNPKKKMQKRSFLSRSNVLLEGWIDWCFLFFEDPWITGFLSEYVTVWPTRHDAQILNPVLHQHLHFLCHFCPVEASSALFVLHSHQHLLQHLLLSPFQPSSISSSEGRPETSSSNKQRSRKHKSIQRVQQVVIIKSSLQFNLFLILIREGLEGEIIIQSDLFLIWGFGGRNQA